MQPNDILPPALEQGFCPLSQLSHPRPLKSESPYPFLRVLLNLALEEESQAILHTLLPSFSSQELRRDLSLLSRVEARQAVSLTGWLKERNRPEILGLHFSLLSLELAASLAQRMNDGPVRRTLDFFIPEYLDELYRLVNLLSLNETDPLQTLLGGYAEIMPGRPLIACHRHPYDCVARSASSLSLWERIALLTLSAVEKEKYRGFLWLAGTSRDTLSSGFFAELSVLSQQHLVQYASLRPPAPPLEEILFSQYTECYLYDACAQLCPNQDLAHFALEERDHEYAHTKKAAHWLALESGEKKPLPAFPPPLSLGPCKGYVRDTLQNIGVTAQREEYVPVGTLPRGADFFRYQKRVCPDAASVPSHRVVESVIRRSGCDYRFEIAPHPVEILRDRAYDHTDLGR